MCIRDSPECAREAFETVCDPADPGLNVRLTFNPAEDIAAPFLANGAWPRIAILREQGVNGQVEMAAAFDRAGFAAVDVHMSDLIAGRVTLADFHGFAACGGFSYGDVLGAGEGWAKSILFNPCLLYTSTRLGRSIADREIERPLQAPGDPPALTAYSNPVSYTHLDVYKRQGRFHAGYPAAHRAGHKRDPRPERGAQPDCRRGQGGASH